MFIVTEYAALMPQPLSWQWNNDLVIEKFKYSTFGASFWIRIREYFGHLCAYLQSRGNSKSGFGDMWSSYTKTYKVFTL